MGRFRLIIIALILLSGCVPVTCPECNCVQENEGNLTHFWSVNNITDCGGKCEEQYHNFSCRFNNHVYSYNDTFQECNCTLKRCWT